MKSDRITANMYKFGYYLFILVQLMTLCCGWRAIPANQAMYALRSSEFGIAREYQESHDEDEKLPRDVLNNIYKFGWCTPDATARPFLHKVVNITFPTWQSSQTHYVYLIARKNTIRFSLQCIVLKSYVPLKFQFYNSRMPLYYCQGEIYILMLNTINRYEIHEFFLQSKLNMPVDFSFEFYHPIVV